MQPKSKIQLDSNMRNFYPSICVASTKSAAKIASDFKKPDGFTIIYPDRLQNFLENLEVDRIAGIGTKTRQALKDEMSIQTIGQLAKCDIQKLMDRFGKKIGLLTFQGPHDLKCPLLDLKFSELPSN